MEIQYIELSKLHPYEGNPFRVADDDQMKMLIDSIKATGVIEPLIVRPNGSGEYEIISGHRRYYACRKLNCDRVPVYSYDMSDREAVITLIDSNLYRDGLLPSEKARAYKMKYDVLKHQGQRTDLTSRQIVGKLNGELSSSQILNIRDDNERTIQRYIRLNYLIPELLRLVDERKMGVTPAVEISYLPEKSQRELLETIESEQATPSLSQAQKLKNAYENGELDMDRILEIMTESKRADYNSLKLSPEIINKYFRPGTTPKRMQEIIEVALQLYIRQQRIKNRNAR